MSDFLAKLQNTRATRPAKWWRVAPGVTWIQCHAPAEAERIRKLKGARLVAYGVNVFLRTFEMPHPLAWVEALMRKPKNPPRNRVLFRQMAQGVSQRAGECRGSLRTHYALIGQKRRLFVKPGMHRRLASWVRWPPDRRRLQARMTANLHRPTGHELNARSKEHS